MFSQSLLLAGFETMDGTEGVQTSPNENKHIHEQELHVQQQLNKKNEQTCFFFPLVIC